MSNLDNSVKKFGYNSYEDYLKSDTWASFKAKYRASSLPQNCLLCNSEFVQLHHISYKRICRETLEDVIPLCGSCHKREHKEKIFYNMLREHLPKEEHKPNKKKKRNYKKIKGMTCKECLKVGFLRCYCKMYKNEQYGKKAIWKNR